MDIKKMKGVCAELLRGLDVRVPAPPDVLFAGLCTAMGRRQDRPVVYKPVAFPPRTVSGLWIATEAQHWILVEAHTVPEHQLVILGHELWHLEDHQDGVEPLGASEAAQLLAPGVDAETVQQVALRVAARTDYCEGHETEAETFGSLLGARARKWLSPAGAQPSGGAGDTDLIRRLETSLGRQGDTGRRHA